MHHVAEAAAHARLPLVYACSGCSRNAQLANYVAVQLDRRGYAEMSCIAGVGGDVRQLVEKARSVGRTILAIDGCPLGCAAHCLKRHKIIPTHHHILHRYGPTLREHGDFDHAEGERVLRAVAAQYLHRHDHRAR